MKRLVATLNLLAALLIGVGAVPLISQSNAPDSNPPISIVGLTSRAVLVDVVVTDRNGTPVTGLKKEDFSVSEEGKPQAISFFEEQKDPPKPATAELPVLPPNVFCNFSPFAKPSAVNVLLLDSLNTPMEDQSYVHQKALAFLKTARPGSQMAIFTMSLGLHFVQGFTDDPALLVAGLNHKKINEVEVPALLKSHEEGNADATMTGIMAQQVAAGPGATTTLAPQAMIDALTEFFRDTDVAQEADRAHRTLENLQRLAAFLGGFPGRKNLIWFSESFPLQLFSYSDQRFQDEEKRTVNLLTAARVAVYPVDARGVKGNHFYEAGNTLNPTISSPSQIIGAKGAQTSEIVAEDTQRNSDQEAMSMLAAQSGGKAFANTNNLANVIADIVASSNSFYTVSYSPTNSKMDGKFRRIDVKVANGKYNLSYRRGYYAREDDLPDAVDTAQRRAEQDNAARNQIAANPLQPFMDFGMPQSEQILYKTLIQPLPAKQGAAAAADDKSATKGFPNRYSVDFAVDLNDLRLKATSDGLRQGTLYLSLIVYDRYGHAASRKDHKVALSIKPDVYAAFQKTGVQLHAEIEVPKGQYWLRTGVYDQSSHKVGTLGVDLTTVKPIVTASN